MAMNHRPKKKPARKTITKLTMSDGRIVTDPVEIDRLLRLNGFTVADDGRVGLGEGLKRPQ